jgi:hypothetical protein
MAKFSNWIPTDPGGGPWRRRNAAKMMPRWQETSMLTREGGLVVEVPRPAAGRMRPPCEACSRAVMKTDSARRASWAARRVAPHAPEKRVESSDEPAIENPKRGAVRRLSFVGNPPARPLLPAEPGPAFCAPPWRATPLAEARGCRRLYLPFWAPCLRAIGSRARFRCLSRLPTNAVPFHPTCLQFPSPTGRQIPGVLTDASFGKPSKPNAGGSCRHFPLALSFFCCWVPVAKARRAGGESGALSKVPEISAGCAKVDAQALPRNAQRCRASRLAMAPFYRRSTSRLTVGRRLFRCPLARDTRSHRTHGRRKRARGVG